MRQSLRFVKKSFLTLVCCYGAASAQTVISPTYLNPPDEGGYGFAVGVNSSGQVAGYYTKSGDLSYSLFVWQNGSTIATQLIPNYGSTVGINDAGQVVVSTETNPQIWQNGVFTALPSPSGRAGVTGINNQGSVSGCVILGMIDPVSVVWQNQRLTRVPTGRNISDCALGINNLGQVVGFLQNGPFATAYLSSNGTLTNITVGNQSQANAINDAGQIVGFYYNQTQGSSGPSKAFLWQNGTYQQLLPPNSTDNEAVAIDSQGRVVISSDNFNGWVWKNGTYYSMDQSYRVTGIHTFGTGAIVAGACNMPVSGGGNIGVPCIWYVP